MNIINKLSLTALLTLVPLSMGSCDVAGTSSNDIVAETAIEKEDARLDEVINSYTGDIIDFPMDYNSEKLESLGNGSISDYAYPSQRAGMINAMPYADDVMESYKYGDSIYIVTDHFEDAEYVARGLELMKRRVPTAYDKLFENTPGIDYTVFSFHDVSTGHGDWFNSSYGKSIYYDSTGGNVSFIIGDRDAILFEHDIGFDIDSSYEITGTPEEEYDAVMREIFLAVALHEGLHGFYTKHEPTSIFRPNGGSRNSDIEHVNVFAMQEELATKLGCSDFYLNKISTVPESWYNSAISNNLLTVEQADAVRDYRPF